MLPIMSPCLIFEDALDLPRGNCSNIPPHPLRGRRHFDVAHPEFAERVDNGVDHGTQLQVSRS